MDSIGKLIKDFRGTILKAPLRENIIEDLDANLKTYEKEQAEEKFRGFIRTCGVSQKILEHDLYDNQIDMLNKIKKSIHESFRWPYLYGTNGIGKTFIAKHTTLYAVRALKEKVSFIKAPMFFKDLHKHPDSMTVINNLRYTPYLVLDDLFSHNISQAVLSNLFLILDYRYENKLPVMITSNFKPTELTKDLYLAGSNSNVNTQLCSSVVDRLMGLCIPMSFIGKSVRLIKTKEEIIERKRTEDEIW